MSINEIQMRSPTAAVQDGTQIRFYQLGNDGSVREAAWDGSKWSGGDTSDTRGHFKLTSPLAAASLGMKHIRVYGVDEKNYGKELCYDHDKGWFNGGFDGKFQVAAYADLAAVFLAQQFKIRVYGQSPDNTIQEWSYNEGQGWRKDQNLGHALPGTAITATTWGQKDSEIHIRVYFQGPNGDVIEKCHDPTSTWFDGELTFKATVPRVSLAVASWGMGDGIRVYYGTADGYIREKCRDAGRAWYDGGFVQQSVPSSEVAAMTLGGSNLRVYLQKGADVTAFTEFMWTGSSWKVSQRALPPAKA